jgi:hypothetical protein
MKNIKVLILFGIVISIIIIYFIIKSVHKRSESFELSKKMTTSDKGWHHGYHRFYERFLEPICEKTKAMVEIGLEKGNSVILWNKYFPNAKLYGFDISSPTGEKIWSSPSHKNNINIVGDQSRQEDLEFLKNQIKEPCQFIIDDGSHIPEHQILTFNYLFSNVLEEGGVYIIEDIETSYWKTGGLYSYETRYGYENPKSCIERLKPLIDAVNWEFLNESDRALLLNKLKGISLQVIENLESINFGQNCIIITKRKKDSEIPFDRPYRFRQNNP